MTLARARENLALRREERWQPPTFTPTTGWQSRMAAALRRFFDLQAGSLWRDLSPVLREVRGTILDVGCGAQPYRGLLPAEAQYIGLDTARAHADFGYAIPDVQLIGDDGRWPIEDSRADFVLATETLEHVLDPPAFLAEAQRCLAPGGRIVLTVPFAARWHYIPHDYWRFTPASLQILLERAGFSHVVVHARGNERTVACYKLLALLLPAALPQAEPGAVRVGARALLAAPLAVVLASIANVSLREAAGEDCLGYTVYAVRGS